MEEISIALMLMAFIILALGLMIAAYAVRRKVLAFAACGAWILLSGYSYTRFTDEWDIFYTLFFLAAGFAFISAFEVFALRERKEEGDVAEESDEERAMREESTRVTKERGMIDSILGRRKPRRRKSRFEKTGEL